MRTSSKRSSKDFRFLWKDLIRANHSLSRGARQFAAFAVDKYVFSGKKEFFAQNETLATGLGVHPRTIKRYVKELVETGWMEHTKRRGRRRILLLTIPNVCKGDTEGDSQNRSKVTDLTQKGDTSAPSHKKHENKHVEGPGASSIKSTVPIYASEGNLLGNWEAWIVGHFDIPWEVAETDLKNGSSFELPSRYPPGFEDAATRVICYFVKQYGWPRKP